MLAQLKSVCETNTKAMAETARYYRRTDEAQARRFENKLPAPPNPPVTPFVGPFVLCETMVPEGRLTPPEPLPEPLDPMAVVDALNNLTSPGYYVANILDVLIGVNPADEVSKWIAGDWQSFSKRCGAFNPLGFFCSDIGVNIMDNHRLLLNAWSGKAANGSYDYFSRLATPLEQHKDAFVHLRGEYEKVAAVKTWSKIGELFQAPSNIVRTAKAQILLVLSDNGFKAHPLPGSYRHPALVR